MKRFVCLLLVALACTWATAARASSSTCQAPPGSGAVDQYCEVIPGAKGPTSPATGQSPGAPAPGGIPGAVEKRFAHTGPSGAAAGRALGARPGEGGKPRSGRGGSPQEHRRSLPVQHRVPPVQHRVPPVAPPGGVLNAVGKAVTNGPQTGLGSSGCSWGWASSPSALGGLPCADDPRQTRAYREGSAHPVGQAPRLADPPSQGRHAAQCHP